MTIDTNELRRLAQAATPGPWIAAGPSFGESLPKHLNEVVVDREGDEDDGYSICNTPIGLDQECSDDMAFIAAANPAAINELLDRLEAAEKDITIKEEVIDSLAVVVKRLDAQCDAAEAEAIEQSRLNGMGSEREAALMAKLEAAERERDECNRRRLEAADHFAAQTALMKEQIEILRAKVERMEQQEPVGTTHAMPGASAFTMACFNASDVPVGAKLYALPGAQSVPKAVAYLDLGVGGYMDIGTDLTDEELATLPKGRHMLGIIGTYGVDGYVPAQPALSVPEGWKLVPIEPTEEMIKAANNTPIPAVYLDSISAMADIRTKACYRAMLAAAQPAPSVQDVPAKSLKPVIDWLRNGCDPMKAADELELLIAAAAPEAKP